MDFRSLFDPKKLNEMEAKQLRIGIFALIGVIVLMGLSGMLAFFFSLRGEEKTLVPNILDHELSAALIKLQEKELYPRIFLRFSEDPESRGKILEQEPKAGSIVKVGRRISLVVSRGAPQDKVGDYISQNLDEVKIHLQTVFGTGRQLITVAEPPVYVWNEAAAGTILEQKPDPETVLSGPVELKLVVSRGPEKSRVKVPLLVGLKLNDAGAKIADSGVNFSFNMRPAEGKELPGTIIAQLPAPDTVQDAMDIVNLVYAAPEDMAGMVSGLFVQELPEYSYPLRVVLSAEKPDGSMDELVSVEHPGVLFTWPYQVRDGTVLVLKVANRIVSRVEAGL